MLRSLRNRLIFSHTLPLLIIVPVLGMVLLYVIEIKYFTPNLTKNLKGDAQLIADVIGINPDVWDKVKWYHFLDGKWLMSHGGLHKLNVPDSIKKYRKDRPKFVSELSGYLDHEIRKGLQAGAEGVGSWVFNAGHARWGQQRVGGITWCDFEREFFPVKGINQIVGHTPIEAGSPRWCMLGHDPLNTDGKVWYRYENGKKFFKPEDLDNPELSFNLDLDVYQNTQWAVWNGKVMKFGNYKDL